MNTIENMAWGLYIHVTNFVYYHPVAFLAIAVGGFALICTAEKSLRGVR